VIGSLTKKRIQGIILTVEANELETQSNEDSKQLPLGIRLQCYTQHNDLQKEQKISG
jgi:hypothetical protein